MAPQFFRAPRLLQLTCALALTLGQALAEPSHGIAMYGTPALPPDFVSLPYVNPDAPKGGSITFGEPGSFDSLNPWVRKGTAPWAVRSFIAETLMGRSIDEPFTLYGLLAESVETPPDRSWVEFTLRPNARFSDGSPVTVDDVMWSYATLGTIGHPRYRSTWDQVDKMEQTGPLSIRFTFNTDNRELPLLLGLRPVLKKAQWDGVDFERGGLDTVPIGSSPYVIERVDPGRSIRLKRNPDYWGRDLPFMRGQANFDELRYEYFGDGDVIFEAFKAGELTTFTETNPVKWQRDYDFPAARDGAVVKAEIPNQLPSGIRGFVMNTRRAAFADWRVREAMLEIFNYDYISETIQDNRQPRIASYFSNSVLGMREGPASGRVRQLLMPFADQIPPGTLDGYALPEGDGTPRNRPGLRRAMALMEEAGWSIEDGHMRNAAGAEFTFDILLNKGGTETSNIIDMFVANLSRLGIVPRIVTVDSPQYVERTTTYDFDLTYYIRALSLSPGNEQRYYWGSASADQPGTLNWMGAKSPAIDAMIETLLSAQGQDDFLAAAHALDRLLTAGRYVIPLWYTDRALIAHRATLHYPQRLPMFGAWVGFQPETWWYEE